MKFVSKENAVYVCADSAWINISTATKASCSAELLADRSGFKIVCEGDSVGVIFNGKDCSDGKKGVAGADGKYCMVEESPLLDSDFGRGAYLVVCRGDTVGTLRDGPNRLPDLDGGKFKLLLNAGYFELLLQRFSGILRKVRTPLHVGSGDGFGCTLYGESALQVGRFAEFARKAGVCPIRRIHPLHQGRLISLKYQSLFNDEMLVCNWR